MFSKQMQDLIAGTIILSPNQVPTYLELAQNGNVEARDDLILSYARIVGNIVSKYTPPFPFTGDDLWQEGMIAITKLIDKIVEPELPYLHVVTAVDWYLLNFINKQNKYRSEYSLNEIIADCEPAEQIDILEDPNSNKMIKELETTDQLSYLIASLSLLEQIILILNHGIFGFESYSLESIGQLFDKSMKQVWRLKQSALDKLKTRTKIYHEKELIDLEELKLLVEQSNIEPKHSI